MKKMKGVITAMTTPFDEHDQVDVKALEEQVEFLIQKGVNCLYPCGTTGEMFNMTPISIYDLIIYDLRLKLLLLAADLPLTI